MKAHTSDLAVELDVDGILTRGEEWGGQLIRHISLPPGADFTPLFRGLPDDRCQCAHWGIRPRRVDHGPLRRRHRGD